LTQKDLFNQAKHAADGHMAHWQMHCLLAAAHHQ